LINFFDSINDDRYIFYKNCIKKYLKEKNKKILVIGSSHKDILVFDSLNFTNITHSNLLPSETTRAFGNNENYMKILKKNKIDLIDMRKIPYTNNSFDFVVTNASIHHCSQPHLAFIEMLRVAREKIIIIEARDSMMIRVASKLKLSEEIEFSSIDKNSNDENLGGVDGSSVPNFVYRWTEREVYKLTKSYQPLNNYKISYEYGLSIEDSKKDKILIFWILKYFIYFFFFIFKKQKNLFAIIIEK
jgi:ubiquinone/menaquinone biosynthesis C-methylase UbiE